MRCCSVVGMYLCNIAYIGEARTNNPSVLNVNIDVGRPMASAAWVHVQSFSCALKNSVRVAALVLLQ